MSNRETADILRAKIVELEPFRDRKRPNELQALRSKHFDILANELAGMSQVENARAVGVTRFTVQQVLNNHMVKELMAQAAADLLAEGLDTKAEIIQSAPLALRVAQGVMVDEKAKSETRLKAAFGILDRAGFAPPRGPSSSTTVVNFNDLRERANEIRASIKVESTTKDDG